MAGILGGLKGVCDTIGRLQINRLVEYRVMGTWKYIGVLSAAIAGVAGYAYADSEVQTVMVTGKYTQDGQMRRGRTATQYVVRTTHGDLPILKFPVIGYSSGVEDVYTGITPGHSLTVRVAQWPPRLIGDKGRKHILAVY